MRRSLLPLLALATGLVLACHHDKPSRPTAPTPSTDAASPAKPADPSPPAAADAGKPVPADMMVTDQPVFSEHMLGGAHVDDKLPMLIALHGKLSTPDAMTRELSGLKAPARLIVPQGVPMGRGFVWWDLRPKDTNVQNFALAASEAARRIDDFVRKLMTQRPTLGKPVFVGFSQGAVLTYALLVRDPDLVGSAFTLSGMLPAPLVPSAWPLGKPKPAVHAYHGKLDDIVAIDDDRTGVASLKGLGVQATLKEYPLLTHSMGPLEMADARPKIEEALRAEARALSRTSP